MEINEVLQGTENALLIVRRDDLIEMAIAYADKINETKPEPTKTEEIEPPIPQSEAIRFLGKSRQTFHTWRKRGIVKAHIMGGRVYYFKSELLSAMK
jgi:hypothetical protein